MLVCIPNVLDAAATGQPARAAGPQPTTWVDGRVTAGYQGAPVKFNQQIDERVRGGVCLPAHRRVGARAQPDLHQRRAAQRHLSADVQPLRRGHEVRRACRRQRAAPSARSAASCAPTCRRRCSSPIPTSYDGGELQIEDTYGRHSVKLAAGDMVRLSGDQPAPGGADHARRAHLVLLLGAEPDPRRGAAGVLYEMDDAIQRLNQTNADEVARRTLIGCYHNLVRKWSET